MLGKSGWFQLLGLQTERELFLNWVYVVTVKAALLVKELNCWS